MDVLLIAFNLIYLVCTGIAAYASVKLWRLNNAFERGEENTTLRRKANLTYLASTGLAVIATAGIFIFGLISRWDKDRALELYKAEAAQKVAQANATAESARESAARANEKAETEAVERLKLEKSFAWRKLDNERLSEAARVLSRKPSRVNMLVIPNDPESTYFANQMKSLSDKSGWTVNV
ncbi:hypothetical protein [Methylobacterium nodulans]|uniref:hypothetical protein n=1 Tax=Methylobacterium nodulans TaxID=114616 RepID=UPI0012ED78C8|nr:hypothetical protein [Methylobacterium nodulans]